MMESPCETVILTVWVRVDMVVNLHVVLACLVDRSGENGGLLDSSAAGVCPLVCDGVGLEGK